MRLTRGFTDRSDGYGSVENDSCGVGVSGKGLGLSVKCLDGLVVDVNDVKIEKRRMAKTTVAEGHPAVGGDSAS
ncbi:hypothetical protein L596_009851 [Steinernema carpocapsae]|uniref:Uncharacterized protein n=1 Tax=Steinernema carpocapsae TaxID=34508 RepID=A0A4U5PHC9_STECR|nr:hypothetical protein L596_009851 [Steinernema carpocapsae]